MSKTNDLTISKRIVDLLSVEGKDAVFWDHDLSGFGVRVYPSGRKVYVVQSRGPSGPKRVTLGQHGELAADQARKKAAGVIDRIKQGEDPVSRARDHLGRSGGALHARACSRQLQCAYRGDLSGVARQPYPAGAGNAGSRRGRAGTDRGAALRASQHASGGEPGADDPLQDVCPGRGLGPGCGGRQPLPTCGQVQAAQARAVPDGRGVPPAWAGSWPRWRPRAGCRRLQSPLSAC